MKDFLKFEPLVRNAGIGAVLVAILNWVKVMGYVSWTPEQFAVTENTVLLIASMIILVVATVQPRFKEVTPVVRPRDNNGNILMSEDKFKSIESKKEQKDIDS